jgi:hypothetical protein
MLVKIVLGFLVIREIIVVIVVKIIGVVIAFCVVEVARGL